MPTKYIDPEDRFDDDDEFEDDDWEPSGDDIDWDDDDTPATPEVPEKEE